MPDHNQILYAIEVHSVEGIRSYFDQGGDPNDILPDGVPLFTTMATMYARTPHFKDCVQCFIDAGLEFRDQALLAVFTDDGHKLEQIIRQDAAIILKTYNLFNNTYTPLTGATLLHFCAEYNSVACAKVLLKHNADIKCKSRVG